MTEGMKSSEFWLTIAYGVAKALLPDLDDQVLWAVMAYVAARLGVKATDKIRKPATT